MNTLEQVKHKVEQMAQRAGMAVSFVEGETLPDGTLVAIAVGYVDEPDIAVQATLRLEVDPSLR